MPSSDDVENTVINFINTGCGITIKNSDIDYCFKKINNKNRNNSTQTLTDVVLVKFVSRKTKQLIMDTKYKHKLKLNTTIFGADVNVATPIFINEILTFYTRQLFKATKKAKLENNYKYLWIRNSAVLMRKENGKPIRRINSLEDL